MPTKFASKNEKIVLVDDNDQDIGEAEKIFVHENGMLHRAFSVFIFRYRMGKLQLLLQQRNKAKYHSGGLWTNTCCSHAHRGESLPDSARLCLIHEMGIDVPLKYVGKFHYTAHFPNGLTENEIDHVYVGFYDADVVCFDKEEVENYQWIDIVFLQAEVSAHPEKYTPWFKQALELALTEVKA